MTSPACRPQVQNEGMSDFTDPSGSSIRLSNAEREQAVAALEAHARDGRLNDAELASRSAAARSATTRGDLAPLFADLPGALPASSATGTFVPPAATPGGYPDRPAAPYTTDPANPQRRDSRRWRTTVIAIVPFISLILFFLTSAVWGFAYSWLWFLLIPIVGIALYADGGPDRRDRDRDRDRDRR